MTARRSFVVGRRSRSGVLLVLVSHHPDEAPPQPIHGPWTLEAVITKR